MNGEFAICEMANVDLAPAAPGAAPQLRSGS
jgi:hypothetical protein